MAYAMAYAMAYNGVIIAMFSIQNQSKLAFSKSYFINLYDMINLALYSTNKLHFPVRIKNKKVRHETKSSGMTVVLNTL